MNEQYTIGLDYGTNSVRAVLVNIRTGAEIATAVHEYESGDGGVVSDGSDPLVARHHPADYLSGLEATVCEILNNARTIPGFEISRVIGIGVDTTGSTPVPVDRNGTPLVFGEAGATNPDALAWLWKDHSATAEAEEISAAASRRCPDYLGPVGGAYSSEWFWAKLLRCRRISPGLFARAWSWIEMCDWIPAVLSGETRPERVRRGVCGAGHKAFYHPRWGGWPQAEFIESIDPELARILATFAPGTFAVGTPAGFLCERWAARLGLAAGIPVSVGAFDAHLGGVGAGIAPNVLVKNIGTSTCDMMVADISTPLPDIPGLAGVVPDSILPGFYGLEAGQSAVGDIFSWAVKFVAPGIDNGHAALQNDASRLEPGESGLLALDWHNGNRTVLMDQRLAGTVVGLTLRTEPAEFYRAMLEATAFGSRIIMDRFEEYGCRIDRIVTCGGIALKSPLTMQIYADVLGRTIEISRSSQTGALGSAVAASVAAGPDRGGYAGFSDAIANMTGVDRTCYKPRPGAQATYDRLYGLYRELHDAFGRGDTSIDLRACMKALIAVRDRVRNIPGAR